MLENQATVERLQKVALGGGLLPLSNLLNHLIKLLNKARTEQGKRIVIILEKMLELDELTRPIPPEEPMIAALEWKRTDPKKYQLHWEIEKRRAMLQYELSKYRFTPRAEVVMGGGGRRSSQWAAWWHGNVGKTRETHLTLQPCEALELILRLTQIGYLTRLRRCRRCNKWLYARLQHQTFCSRDCQQKQFTDRPEWREHRRAYMRERYRLLVQNPLRARKTR